MFDRIKKSELLQGSIILFIMINIFNLLNYFFHFLMVRLLEPAEYGILATLMAIVFILIIPSESIQTIVSRYTSKFYKENEFGKIRTLFEKSILKGIKIAMIIFVIYTIISPLLSLILKIPVNLLLITGSIILPTFILPIGKGILQGTKSFYALGSNSILEGTIKLVLAFILVYIGLNVLGAISAVVLAMFLAFLASIFSFRYIFKYKKDFLKIEGIYSYSLAVFILIALVTVLLSIDVIIAKIIFPPELVGKYAVASIIGKMIFFGTQPISKTMFPITSEKSDRKEDSGDILKKSLLLIILIVIPALLIFLFLPDFFVGILFGISYLDISNLIIWTGISFTLLSLSNLFLMSALAQRTVKISKAILFSIVSILIQTIVLYTSSESINLYSTSLVLSNTIILLMVFLFFIRK